MLKINITIVYFRPTRNTDRSPGRPQEVSTRLNYLQVHIQPFCHSIISKCTFKYVFQLFNYLPKHLQIGLPVIQLFASAHSVISLFPSTHSIMTLRHWFICNCTFNYDFLPLNYLHVHIQLRLSEIQLFANAYLVVPIKNTYVTLKPKSVCNVLRLKGDRLQLSLFTTATLRHSFPAVIEMWPLSGIFQ